jgi:hypothetical protein
MSARGQQQQVVRFPAPVRARAPCRMPRATWLDSTYSTPACAESARESDRERASEREHE